MGITPKKGNEIKFSSNLATRFKKLFKRNDKLLIKSIKRLNSYQVFEEICQLLEEEGGRTAIRI